MEKLIVSMMRFSTAVTLFGIEQLQSAMNSMTGGEDLNKTVDRLTQAMNAVTNAMAKELDEQKRQTLGSITSASEEAVNRTFQGMNLGMLDPREVLRTSTDLMKKTSDSVNSWVQRSTDNEGADEPQPASDALSKSKGKQTH